jgi:hypothetical protein
MTSRAGTKCDAAWDNGGTGGAAVFCCLCSGTWIAIPHLGQPPR